MRRLTIFLLFLLLAGLLAPAHFAKAATTSYYGVQFDGSTAYVQTPLPDNFSTAFSVIVIGVFNNQPAGLVGTSKFEGAGYDSGFALSIRYGKFRFRVANASKTATIVGTTAVFGQAVMLAGVFNGTDAQIYMNGKLANSAPCNGYTPRNINITIAKALPDWTSPWYLNGKIYLILIYNRALSDSEIQAIYKNLENPPTDGLVLWYAPDSVDTVNNVWTDKSGNGNDGSIVGATPERVSIPKLSVYDAQNNSEIPVENVSVALIENNTTISLLPSFLTLPYNETVKLNVSASGYESRIVNLPSLATALGVYLTPTPTTTTPPQVPNFTSTIKIPNEFANYSYRPENFNEDLASLFNGSYGFAVMTLMVLALVVGSLKFHKSPIVAAGVLGVSIVYLSTWAGANWGILGTLVAMLFSASILKTFGRWRG